PEKDLYAEMKKRSVYIISSIIYLIIAISFSAFNYFHEREKSLELLNSNLEMAALGLDYILDPNLYDYNENSDNITVFEYDRIKLKLNNYSFLWGMHSVYSMVMENNTIYFVASNETIENFERKIYSKYMNPYPNPPQELLNIFVTGETGVPVFTQYSNEWDNFYSVFIPMESRSGKRYILAADIKAINLNSIMTHCLLWNLLLAFLLLLPVFVAMILIGKKNKQQKNSMTDLLFTDKMTGLQNRKKFMFDINDESSFKNSEISRLSMIMINIDSFRVINNLFGCITGDKVILQMAEYLSKSVPVGWTLYKFPSDEFAFIVPGTVGQKEIVLFVEKIISGVSELTFVPKDQRLDVNITAGITFQPKMSSKLLSQSNLARRHARLMGLNYFVYNESINLERRYTNNYLWLKKLKEAIKDGRLKPFYQPILNLETNKIERYEALIRMIEVDGSVILPAKFLEAAKLSKYYSEITFIVIHDTILNFKDTEYKVSMNLSIRDIMDDETINYLLRMTEENNMGKKLIVEILESDSITEYDIVQQNIEKLRNAGIIIAIDDFGSGYSNFHYLEKFRPEVVKIDGSIIQNINKTRNATALAVALCHLSEEMGFDIVAEYVSDADIMEGIKDLGISHAQGFFIGEPMPFENIISPAKAELLLQ
ncbi:MAG: bifunctional diguanylate cyclase/phosphodiesterase, partial [Spirochaetales bacterium]|nr:bifunctional diguanylate cyclase/phosphodiesterase [Spirochaetales bacterium]